MKIINKEIRFFVDNSIESLKLKGLLWTFDPNISENMKDLDVKNKQKWGAWKAIDSVINKSELEELEAMIGYKYPTLYKEFLQYKHFYRLEKIQGIEFFTHTSDSWRSDIINQYKIHEPEVIIKKGFIPFGFYEGGKMACFDTNNNFKVVSIFYDPHLNMEPEIELLFENFDTLIHTYYEKNS